MLTKLMLELKVTHRNQRMETKEKMVKSGLEENDHINTKEKI